MKLDNKNNKMVTIFEVFIENDNKLCYNQINIIPKKYYFYEVTKL